MIKSYRDKKTEAFAGGEFVKRFQGVSRQAEKSSKSWMPPKFWPI